MNSSVKPAGSGLFFEEWFWLLIKLEECLHFTCKWQLLSHVWLFVAPGTVTHQAPPSMQFSRQEYWSGLPFSSPGDLPDPGNEPRFPALSADFYLHCCSVAQLCLALCDLMDSSPPGSSVLHYLPEFAQIYVQWVSDANLTISSAAPSFAFNLSQHQGLFQWVGSSYQVAKVLEIQL